MIKDHEYYMREALKEAEKAYKLNEIPVGAIVVCDDKIIARAHNNRESTNLVTSHAEIMAIEKANRVLGSWRLDSCSLYVTIEPCPMCSGAIIQSRMKEVVYGANELKAGAHKSTVHLYDYPYNHRVNVVHGILENECSTLMKQFFKDLRVK